MMVEGWLASGRDWSNQGAIGVVRAGEFGSSDQVHVSEYSKEQLIAGHI